MRRAIELVDMAAFGTLAGRVARVHLDHDDTRERGLVDQKKLQLQKRLYPASDSAEIFNGNPSAGAFSRGNDLLRNYVISVAKRSSLPASFFNRRFAEVVCFF